MQIDERRGANSPRFTQILRDSTRVNTSRKFKYCNFSTNFTRCSVVTANQHSLPEAIPDRALEGKDIERKYVDRQSQASLSPPWLRINWQKKSWREEGGASPSSFNQTHANHSSELSLSTHAGKLRRSPGGAKILAFGVNAQ